jgi:hypothetical protein
MMTPGGFLRPVLLFPWWTLREDRLRIDDQELRDTLAIGRSVVGDVLRAGGAQR